MLNRRELLQAGAAGLAGAALGIRPSEAAGGEVLCNGIVLPEAWPPRLPGYSPEPVSCPYLAQPPDVIPIDVGRQLFVDDFLIAESSLRRTFHAAEYHAGSPVLRPDRPWEQTEPNPCAMVFSDGVWYDPAAQRFKMWYMGGYVKSTCYATSADGLHWEKPELDVVPGTNIVHPRDRDSTTVWLDPEDRDPARRYKLFRSHRRPGGWGLSLHFSADGIHWNDAPFESGPCGDRTTAFYNPFRKVWVYSVRAGDGQMGRVRAYREHPDVLAGLRWKEGEPSPWIGADRLDPQRSDLKTPPQLYNLDAMAYESVLVGLFDIWRGQPRDRAKPNELCVGFSRDGFHWHRPSHAAFIPVSERHGDFHWGNVQSAGGGCLVVGDRLYFYASARAGVRGSTASGACTTTLATLRRDGFASLDADEGGGAVTTRPVRFSGRRLFVNLDVPRGELRAEVLDERGRPLAPFTRGNCVAVRGDRTRAEVRWKGVKDLERLAGRPVRLRFHLAGGRLYSFWVSPDERGASRGYVAAGGPGFSGFMDV